MGSRIAMGQYYPADSPIHRLDPRARIGCALVLMVTVLVQTPAQLALCLALAAAVLLASRVPAAEAFRSIRPLVLMLALLGLFNLLYVTTGTTLVTLGPATVTSDGVWWALCYPLRLSAAVLYAALILHTTTPMQITDAFDAALSPLSRLGLPGHELAMVFSLMLRFIPTIADEASAILDAQASRGASMGEGSPLRRLRAVGPVVIALVASSARHAEGLSRALDARCYVGGGHRSHWHPLRAGRRDAVAAAIVVAYLVALVLLG